MTWSESAGRAIVYQRSARFCEVCGRQGASVHHRVKKGQGGEWDPANTLSLCGDGVRYCHGWIEAHPTYAMDLGLWVRAGIDPATVPLWCTPAALPPGWWTLHSDGTLTWHLDRNHLPPPPAVAVALEALWSARQITVTSM